MLHWLVVGHFNPLGPVDTTAIPHRPKPQRPIPLATAEEALAAFGHDIRQFLAWEEPGFVVCDSTFAPAPLSDRVWEFAYFLARRESAVVMSEAHCVYWPPASVNANEGVAKYFTDARGDSPLHPVPVTCSARAPPRISSDPMRHSSS